MLQDSRLQLKHARHHGSTDLYQDLKVPPLLRSTLPLLELGVHFDLWPVLCIFDSFL
ncbi:MAG: tRNA lysidine(34) synthetase TilS, partial [Lachnospiraceae bacterium]|nr:tRNA lysidine(34) synthetase TilS [Lachnospiraceae bacterium]